MSTQTVEQKKVENVKTLVVAQSAKPTEEAKKASILATIEKFKPEPPKTAEERILRKDQFDALTKRYLHLKEKSNDLKMFEAGNDKNSCSITFKNGQDFKFEIKNINVIEKLCKGAQDELSVLLTEAESEVLTFQI
jgi:hypothetical protein